MIAVKADNLTKTYRFYHKPVHRLVEAVLQRPMHKAFSALEDVSFSVAAGATLGIIGENGAGKSTLLKILARTLYPSDGTIDIQGRVAALLELGAGFHAEFTGRQNIYLNASLMGLSEREIKSKEGEIIDFAEIGDFIDRPIKTYSSGMVVRLAFSIATSVDPDILVVDEALSVGDQSFQEKCIARMLQFRNVGKTIIVCSHSMYLINELSSQCMWLDNGRVRRIGETNDVVSKYLAYMEEIPADKPRIQSHKQVEVRIEQLKIRDADGILIQDIKQFSRVYLEIDTKNYVPEYHGHLGVTIESGDGEAIFSTTTRDIFPYGIRFTGAGKYTLILPQVVLQKGALWFRGIITNKKALRIVDQKSTGPFQIVSKHPEYGLMWMDHTWDIDGKEMGNGY